MKKGVKASHDSKIRGNVGTEGKRSVLGGTHKIHIHPPVDLSASKRTQILLVLKKSKIVLYSLRVYVTTTSHYNTIQILNHVILSYYLRAKT